MMGDVLALHLLPDRPVKKDGEPIGEPDLKNVIVLFRKSDISSLGFVESKSHDSIGPSLVPEFEFP